MCCRSTGSTRFRRRPGRPACSARFSTTGRLLSSPASRPARPRPSRSPRPTTSTSRAAGTPGGSASSPDAIRFFRESERSHQRWFNTSCFVRPSGRGDEGNSSRVHYFGPGSNTWDLTLTKGVKLGGSRQAQLRAEFYNLFNHPTWQTVNSGRGSTRPATRSTTRSGPSCRTDRRGSCSWPCGSCSEAGRFSRSSPRPSNVFGSSSERGRDEPRLAPTCSGPRRRD